MGRHRDDRGRWPATHTVYTRTRLLTTDDQQAAGQQPADVLVNPADGSMWQAVSSGDWDEAKGYAVRVAAATSCYNGGMKIPSPQELQQQVNAELGPIADAKVAEIVAGMKRCTWRPITVDVNVPYSV